MEVDLVFLSILLAGNAILAIVNWRLHNSAGRLLQDIRKRAKADGIKLPE